MTTSNVRTKKYLRSGKMKASQPFIFFALIFVGCVALRGAPLTADQAKALAIQLANEKFASTNSVPAARIFETNTPIYYFGATHIKTNFLDGRYIFDLQKYEPQLEHLAHVELAADGSTNKVTVSVRRGMP
jgi:hypothetical protein